MWASADLEVASANFEQWAGIKLDAGGSHPRFGTRNRLTGLGGNKYFEVMAPDPEQEIVGTFGEQFLQFKEPRIHAVIFRSNNLERVQKVYRKVGIEVDIIEASRITPEGQEIRWRMLSVAPGRLTQHAPRFLDWLKSPHPSARVQHACSLRSLSISHPDPDALTVIWKAHGLEFPINEGSASYAAILETPNGEITL